MKRFGTEYGGYCLPSPLPLNKDSVIYSFGVGEDVSFDVELAHESKATVHLFDFTPRAIQHVKDIQDFLSDKRTLETNPRYGGGEADYLRRIKENPIDKDQLILHEYGLFTKDTGLVFYYPENPEYVSLTARKQNTDKTLTAPVKCLETIMKELNHDHIDVLKLDVEGVELVVLNQLLQSKIRPRFIAVDFDSARVGLMAECIKMVKRLHLANYEVIDFKDWNCSFRFTDPHH
jgi:FkbM family methyltransferase